MSDDSSSGEEEPQGANTDEESDGE
jgi:hypothetical protein